MNLFFNCSGGGHKTKNIIISLVAVLTCGTLGAIVFGSYKWRARQKGKYIALGLIKASSIFNVSLLFDTFVVHVLRTTMETEHFAFFFCF